MEIITLKKEDLSSVRFSTMDVISDATAKKLLMSDLLRAQTLGNIEKNKVKIIFHLLDGSRGEVTTTVWGVGEHHLMLKGGVNIPIRSVESIIII